MVETDEHSVRAALLRLQIFGYEMHTRVERYYVVHVGMLHEEAAEHHAVVFLVVWMYVLMYEFCARRMLVNILLETGMAALGRVVCALQILVYAEHGYLRGVASVGEQMCSQVSAAEHVHAEVSEILTVRQARVYQQAGYVLAVQRLHHGPGTGLERRSHDHGVGPLLHDIGETLVHRPLREQVVLEYLYAYVERFGLLLRRR